MKQHLTAWRAAMRRIHPVDQSLLLFMLILLVQSAANLFFPAGDGSVAGEIDIVVRTSAAAIFGYFLSANFIGREEDGGQATKTAQAHTLKAGTSPVQDSAPRAQIGFFSGEPAEDPDRPELRPPEQSALCLQVRCATFIGLFCLAALLLLRSLTQLGVVPSPSDSVTGTIVQFRDFISGCVGFLIGCPTHQLRVSSTEY